MGRVNTSYLFFADGVALETYARQHDFYHGADKCLHALRGRQESALIDERLSQNQSLRVIDAEYLNRCPANRRSADKQRPNPLKTPLSMVLPRIEQLHKLACLGIDTGAIWLLEAIAVESRRT